MTSAAASAHAACLTRQRSPHRSRPRSRRRCRASAPWPAPAARPPTPPTRQLVRDQRHDDAEREVRIAAIVAQFPYNLRSMGEPVIVPRAAHSISRKQIDPDALKVLYRLHQNNYVAYLVGGSVRDLLLGRRPKDFDIGTSAHPYQVKTALPELLDHRPALPAGARAVRDEDDRGRDVPPAGDSGGAGRRGGSRQPETARDACSEGDAGSRPPRPSRQHVRHAGRGRVPPRLHHQRALLRHRRRSRSSTTPAASRICAPASSAASATRPSASRRTRCGCCAPSRWPRGSASRSTRRSTRRSPRTRGEIARSAPARLIEEFYKLLRSGASEQAFRMLAERRLLEPIAHELQNGAGDASVAVAGRARRLSAAIRGHPRHADQRHPARLAARAARALAAQPAADARHGRRASRRSRDSRSGCCRWRGATSSGCGRSSACSGG